MYGTITYRMDFFFFFASFSYFTIISLPSFYIHSISTPLFPSSFLLHPDLTRPLFLSPNPIQTPSHFPLTFLLPVSSNLKLFPSLTNHQLLPILTLPPAPPYSPAEPVDYMRRAGRQHAWHVRQLTELGIDYLCRCRLPSPSSRLISLPPSSLPLSPS